MLSRHASSLLKAGLNELMTVASSPVLLQSYTSVPDFSALSFFSLVVTDETSSPMLVARTFQLVRRLLPVVGSVGSCQFLQPALISTKFETEQHSVVVYEKALTLVALLGYVEKQHIRTVCDSVLALLPGILRIQQQHVIESFLTELRHVATTHPDAVWDVVATALSDGLCVSHFLRLSLELLDTIDEPEILTLMPSLLTISITITAPKDIPLSMMAHDAVVSLLHEHLSILKPHFEQYVFLLLDAALSPDTLTVPSLQYNGVIDRRVIFLDYLSQVLTFENSAVTLFVNFDCDPTTLDLLQYITEQLLQIQAVFPTLMHKTREIMMSLLSSVPPGTTDIPEASHKHKETLRQVVKEFNANPEKGLLLLQTHCFPTQQTLQPKQVAEFFFMTNGLDKQLVGDYFEDRGEFVRAVLREFIGLFCRTADIQQAFVEFVQTIQLPKETNSITHIFQDFAETFHALHPTTFTSDEALFIISGMLLLNVELHHPNMKQRRSKESFVSAMAETTPTVSSTIFASIYDFIEKNEFLLYNETPSNNLSRLAADLRFRTQRVARFVPYSGVATETSTEIVTALAKPLVQILQTQFELADTTTTLDAACKAIVDLAQLAKTINSSVVMDLLIANFVRVSTVCNHPDLSTYAFDVKAIRVTSLLLDLFVHFHTLLSRSMDTFCYFLACLKHLDLFPEIPETKPSIFLDLFKPHEPERTQSWLSSLLGDNQAEEMVAKTKTLFKTKSPARQVVVVTTTSMTASQLVLFVDGLKNAITRNSGESTHEAMSAMWFLHVVFELNWNKADVFLPPFLTWMQGLGNADQNDQLHTFLCLMLLSLTLVVPLANEHITLLAPLVDALPPSLLDTRAELVGEFLAALAGTIETAPTLSSFLDALSAALPRSPQLSRIITQHTALFDRLVALPCFGADHAQPTTTILCQVYKVVAQTPHFPQYTGLVIHTYQRLVSFVVRGEGPESLVSNVQTLSLFLFVAACHPNATIRAQATGCFQTTAPAFFAAAAPGVVETFFKSLTTFARGICEKRRPDIPSRVVELACKVFLAGHAAVMAKAPAAWTLILEMVAGLHAAGQVTDEIKETLRNAIWVMILEERLNENEPVRAATWQLVGAVVPEADFALPQH